MIDVKTDAQFAEMDIAAESRRAVSELFGDADEEELSRIGELPGVDATVAQSLLDNGIDYIEDFLELSQEQLDAMENITSGQIEALRALIEESIEIVESGEEEEGADEEEYSEDDSAEGGEEETEEVECPECQTKFALDIDKYSGGTINCPNCGAELELSYEKEEEEQEE
jgi:N utilization substance protein A